MALYVIADLHLQAKKPALTQALVSFTHILKPHDELFILGDLFNFFIGSDKHNPIEQELRALFTKLRQQDISVYFIHGNRDFLLNQDEAKSLGCTLLPDLVIVERHNQLLLLTHGDLFCTNDHNYQRFREKVNQPWRQALFRLLPLSIRRRIGDRIRNQSATTHRSATERHIYGVVAQALAAYCYAPQQPLPKSLLNHATTITPLPLQIVSTAKAPSLERAAPAGADRAEPAGADRAEPADAARAKPNRDMALSQVDYIVHGHIHEFGTHTNEVSGMQCRYVVGAWGEKISYFKLAHDGAMSLVELDRENISAIASPHSVKEQ